MLKDASASGTAAPSSLNGFSIGTTDEEEWVERRNSSQSDRMEWADHATGSKRVASPRRSIDGNTSMSTPSSLEPLNRSRTPDKTMAEKPTIEKSRHRSSTILSLTPAPAKVATAKQNLTVSARGSTSLEAATTSHFVLPTSSVAKTQSNTRTTISSLLDQLTDIHDKQQQGRMIEWDAFLKKRSKVLSKSGHSGETVQKGRKIEEDMRWGPGLIGISQMGLSGKSGLEDNKVFAKLVRHGIPLAYRSDVWAGRSPLFSLVGKLTLFQSVRALKTPWSLASMLRYLPYMQAILRLYSPKSRKTFRGPFPATCSLV